MGQPERASREGLYAWEFKKMERELDVRVEPIAMHTQHFRHESDQSFCYVAL
jgi:hypothetical protein